MATSLKIEAVLRFIDRATRPLKRVGNAFARFSRKAHSGLKKVNKITSKIGKTMMRGLKVGIQAATTAVVGLGAATAKVIRTGADFEKTLVSAAVKMGPNVKRGTDAYQKLEDKARSVGASTEFSATEAAQAIEYLALAGFDAEQSIGALDSVVNLATAANIDLATASDIATDTLGAMGLATKDPVQQQKNLQRVMDVMAKTSSSTNTDMVQLFESIKAGGSVATDAGASLEDFSALVGTMANSGIKGEAAGTALRNMFLRLQAPTGAAAQLVKKYIGNIEDKKTHKMRNMIDILGDLTQKMDGLGSIEKAKILNVVFGLRSIGPTSVAIRAGAQSIGELRDSLNGAAGESARMAGEIRNTVSGSMDSLWSSIESVTLSLFKLKDGGIKDTIDKMTGWVRANESLISSKVGDFINYLINNFDDLVAKATLLAKVTAVILGIVTAVKVLTGVIGALNLVIAANPIVLLITAALLVIAAVVAFIIGYWDEIKLGWKILTGYIIEKWKQASVLVMYAFKTVSEFVKDVWSWIKYTFQNGVDFIMNGPVKYFNEGVKVIKTGWSLLSDFFSELWGDITATIESAVDSIMDFIQPVIDAIAEITAFAQIGSGVLFGDKSFADAVMEGQSAQSNMVSPEQRTAKILEEKQLTNNSRTEVVIKDESGKASVTKGSKSPNFKFQPTGNF